MYSINISPNPLKAPKAAVVIITSQNVFFSLKLNSSIYFILSFDFMVET